MLFRSGSFSFLFLFLWTRYQEDPATSRSLGRPYRFIFVSTSSSQLPIAWNPIRQTVLLQEETVSLGTHTKNRDCPTQMRYPSKRARQLLASAARTHGNSPPSTKYSPPVMYVA